MGKKAPSHKGKAKADAALASAEASAKAIAGDERFDHASHDPRFRVRRPLQALSALGALRCSPTAALPLPSLLQPAAPFFFLSFSSLSLLFLSCFLSLSLSLSASPHPLAAPPPFDPRRRQSRATSSRQRWASASTACLQTPSSRSPVSCGRSLRRAAARAQPDLSRAACRLPSASPRHAR